MIQVFNLNFFQREKVVTDLIVLENKQKKFRYNDMRASKSCN